MTLRRRRMKANWYIGGLITSLAFLASPAALAQKPLRMDIAPLVQPAPAAASVAPRATQVQRVASRRSFSAPAPDILERDRRLTDKRMARNDALSTLGVGLLTGLDPADTTTDATPAAGYPVLHFQKRGHLARDIKRGYRNMGEKLARRVFDEPRGKRIVFDIEGRPGIGVEVPIK
jgi:hypothetical protein